MGGCGGAAWGLHAGASLRSDAFVPRGGEGIVGTETVAEAKPTSGARLVIGARNYSSWSLRGWLLCKLAGLDFTEEVVPPSNPKMRAELLLLSPSMLVPCLRHDGLAITGVLAIAEYLHELLPRAGLLPEDRAERARCRSVSSEMHAGFAPLRSALPMNLRGDFPGFRVWSRAQADLDRIFAIWRDCLARSDGPYLFGGRPTMADAMFAPVATRIRTYRVPADETARAYCETLFALPAMAEWIAAARVEPVEIGELDVQT